MLKCKHSLWSLAVGAFTEASSIPKTHDHTIQRPNGCHRAKFDSDSEANVLVHNSRPNKIIHSVSLNADEYSERTPQSWEAELAHSQKIQPNYRDVVDIGSRASLSDLRRANQRAGCFDPGPNPEHSERPARAFGTDHAVHQPRPASGAPNV